MTPSFKAITIPAIGDPTKLSLITDSIANMEYLNTRVGSGNNGVYNGNMEQDTNADGIPDGWALTAYTGGAVSTDTNSADGQAGLLFTSTDSNGGGEAVSDDYIPVNASSKYNLKWWTKSSAVDVSNKVTALYYDVNKDALDPADIWSEDTNNATDWTLYARTFTTDASARFMKVKLVGGVEGTNNGGNTFFDGVDFFTPEALVNWTAYGTNGNYTPSQNVIGAHVFTILDSDQGSPQSFGDMTFTDYAVGHKFYEMTGGTPVAYVLDVNSRAYLTSYGAPH
jgi:hypothetical protein